MLRRLARSFRTRDAFIAFLLLGFVGLIVLSGTYGQQRSLPQIQIIHESNTNEGGIQSQPGPGSQRAPSGAGAGTGAELGIKSQKIGHDRSHDRSVMMNGDANTKYSLPISPTLIYPPQFAEDPLLKSHDATLRQYGFNLAKSNLLPLNHFVPDLRSKECKALKYPALTSMPKVTVIIIFYNEVGILGIEWAIFGILWCVTFEYHARLLCTWVLLWIGCFVLGFTLDWLLWIGVFG